jgi:hypothetical protein
MLADRTAGAGTGSGERLFGEEACMRYRLLACSIRFVVGVAVTLGLQLAPAQAQIASSDAGAAARNYSPAVSSFGREAVRNKAWSTPEEPYIGRGAPQWRYFVEFRARNAASYGHMYVMFGEVNVRHEIIKSEIAGIFPAGDARDCKNCSIYYWTIGHVLPVPSEIGASDGDLEEQYVLARFRVWVDLDQYKRLSAYVKERKANKEPWNAFFANCVIFGRDIASFLDLKMPPMATLGLLYPKDMVEALREANGTKQAQLPLKDASGSLARESGPKAKAEIGAAESTAEKPDAKKAAAAPSSSKKHLANQRYQGKAESSAIH